MRQIIIFILLFVITVSCATHNRTIQVPVELPSNSYYYGSKVRDTVLLDSVSRWYEGDTVYIYREKTRIINIADTLIQKDSIPRAIMLETIDELNIEYLDRLTELKSLLFRILSP